MTARDELALTRMALLEVGCPADAAWIDHTGTLRLDEHRVPAELAWRAGNLIVASHPSDDPAEGPICWECFRPAYLNHNDMNETAARCRSSVPGEQDCGGAS